LRIQTESAVEIDADRSSCSYVSVCQSKTKNRG
jgi:hypothetical protein